MHRLIYICLFILLLSGCKQQKFEPDSKVYNAKLLHKSVKKLSDIIVNDIVSPPVASRMYAYPTIAAYEVMAKEDPSFRSYAGQLNDFNGIPDPPEDGDICFPCASLKAFFDVSRHLVFSEFLLENFEKETFAKLAFYDIPEEIMTRSLAYGESAAQAIIEWSKQDGYGQSRKLAKFNPSNGAGKWKPTPPDFIDAIEPNWNTIRPFTLQKAGQFIPAPPPPFDMNENSEFHKEVMIVYNAVSDTTSERAEIARFWDCNPFSIKHNGHLMLGIKKITPGGHWVGITSQVCRLSRKSFIESAEIYSLTCIALADAFISCWDEKYRSNLIRPETVINAYIDPNWQPILTTPPFPEHTSGHSVISSAAAVVLTHKLGEKFSFADSVEVEYGLPVRSFDSFYEASSEAAISRLYGGIHYMPAITEGIMQGKQVGNVVVNNLQTRVE